LRVEGWGSPDADTMLGHLQRLLRATQPGSKV
jgi:hypothetical protein